MTTANSPSSPHPRRRHKLTASLLALGVLLVGAALGLLWFFGGEAPPEVNLDVASSVVTGETSPQVDDIEGTWTVDTSVGEFTLSSATTSTFVGFRVNEVLRSIGATTAVGRTPTVTGSIGIEGETLTSATITADLTDLVSDESRRNNPIQRALGTSSNPNATFVLSAPLSLGDGAASGEAISVTVTGVLTINGVSRDVEVDLDAQLVNGMILIAGTTEVVFSNFGVTAPTAQSVLSVEDHGIVEIQLWLTRTQA